MTSSQFVGPQFPPENPIHTFLPNIGEHPYFYPYRGGGYQLRSMNHLPKPPRNPFDEVYNEKGDKLTCKMVCSPVEDVEEVDESSKRDSVENKIEKKEDE